MMKKPTLPFIVILVALAFTACSAAPTATTVPTQVPPTEIPTQVPPTQTPTAVPPTETPAPVVATPQAGIPADAALKITGNVENEIGWAEATIRAMPTTKSTATNNSGSSESYTGVLITSLLEQAGVRPDATTIVFIGDTTLEVPVADVLNCTDCIASFRNKGGFSLVGTPFGGMSVKGLKEIQVK